MSYIDTSDSLDSYDYRVLKIFSLLDVIEDKTNIMAQDNDKISLELSLWNNRELSDKYFLNFLEKYLESNF